MLGFEVLVFMGKRMLFFRYHAVPIQVTKVIKVFDIYLPFSA